MTGRSQKARSAGQARMVLQGSVSSSTAAVQLAQGHGTAILDGRYELLRQLGRGAHGTVWEARDLETSELRAIKALDSAKSASGLARKRFFREIASASALHHPHSVEVLAHGETPAGVPYLVMERLPGRTLAAELRERGPFGPVRAIRIVGQILDALAAAHELGIVHRDIKPSNVMLVSGEGESDFVKVCDFGLAKAIEGERRDHDGGGARLGEFESVTTEQGELCGTPEFMAPEQARGESIDGRADLYAVGVMLFQAVVGTLPFQGRSALATISLHLSAPPPRPSALRPGIFPALEAMILRALAKDRAERPSSARVFRADLLQVLRDYAEAEPRDRTPTITDRSSSGLRRDAAGRLRLAARAVLLLAVAAVAGFAGQRLSRTPARATADPSAPPPAEARHVARGAASGVVAFAPAASPQLSGGALPTLASAHESRSGAAPRAHSLEAPAAVRRQRRAREAPLTRHEPREHLARGEELLGEGRIAEACAFGRALWQAGPPSAATAEFLGRCHMRLGDAPAGRAYYRKFLELAPTDSRNLFVRAILDSGGNSRHDLKATLPR